jgi:hypothetical protein
MATASKLGRNKVSSERDITAAPECKYFSIACVPNENQKVIGLDENNFDSVIHLRPNYFRDALLWRGSLLPLGCAAVVKSANAI